MTVSLWHQVLGRFNNMPFPLLQLLIDETQDNTQAPLELGLLANSPLPVFRYGKDGDAQGSVAWSLQDVIRWFELHRKTH